MQQLLQRKLQPRLSITESKDRFRQSNVAEQIFPDSYRYQEPGHAMQVS